MELWRDIRNWEKYYEVSNFGRVRSKPRRYWRRDYRFKEGGCYVSLRPIIMKPFLWEGYERINLRRRKKCKNCRIHRLVWEAFNASIPEGYHIDHIDNSRSNNKLENLQVLSPKEHNIETIKRIIKGPYDPDKGKKWCIAYNKGFSDGFEAAKRLMG